ncbi:hypothetical protein F441_00128 [Phytophthora nicotianae CJ01A1]|uniref:Uncharacterized protein n=4 Tax=Phytophthora nicotianae TaxID=4792 RepID=W3A7Y5_PHYNI|nr:hypothetical protein L916_00118 [Phytophthora nicotianae]ETM56997.1 hypothetical protein L914_00119 [Phytophthora nicotianae]ETO86349.1 hypothetical protein F444_00124 [Phytophthora nicotianae P1976]ETP27379.1 hypothetical protein F441_00128 [Phytophthora nicotianae CJ01A1]ETP55330.1 hypothetical protein F442_00116 [Phytophthora nicotianae P10297]
MWGYIQGEPSWVRLEQRRCKVLSAARARLRTRIARRHGGLRGNSF